MGQRHQVYVRLPAIDYGKGNPNNRKPLVIGLHHQWLYGRTAIRLLANFFRFYAAAKGENGEGLEYSPLVTGDGAQALIGAIWSCDVAEGYWHGIHPLIEANTGSYGPSEVFNPYQSFKPAQEVENPYCGDNNDGITVIDLIDIENPAYCFYTLDGIEGDREAPAHAAISAEEYVLYYYPGMKQRDGSDAKDWIVPELAVIAPYRVLKKSELFDIFPKMDRKESLLGNIAVQL